MTGCISAGAGRDKNRLITHRAEWAGITIDKVGSSFSHTHTHTHTHIPRAPTTPAYTRGTPHMLPADACAWERAGGQ